MAEFCGVCHGPVPFVGTVFVGGFDGDDSEMALCPDCASMVFPGLSDAMRSHCPICAMDGGHSMN